MKTLFGLLIFMMIGYGLEAVADNSCSRVIFNCDSHRLIINGKYEGPLDCGVSTPMSHTGRIGQRSRAAGSRWRCLAGKPMFPLGLGPVIVHTPCGGRNPKGQNQHFAHSGCMNVSPKAIAALNRCQGSYYQIKYASKYDGNTRYAQHRSHKSNRVQYAEIYPGFAGY